MRASKKTRPKVVAGRRVHARAEPARAGDGPPGRGKALSPAKVGAMRSELDHTRRALHERTVNLTQICDSAPWAAVRALGAARRLAIRPLDGATRTRELHELRAVVTHLAKPGVLVGYETRGWSAVRILGALRRLAAGGDRVALRHEIETALRRLVQG